MERGPEQKFRLPRIVRVKSERWRRQDKGGTKLIFGKSRGKSSGFTSCYTNNFRDSGISSLKFQQIRAEKDKRKALERVQRITEMREKLEISKREMMKRKRKAAELKAKQNRAALRIQKQTHRFLRYVRKRNQIRLNILQNKCATRLQAHIREYLGRLRYKQMRSDWTRSSVKIQQKVRSFLEIQRAKHHLCYLRSERAKLRQRTIREYYDTHVTVIQRHCRGRLGRRKFRRVKEERIRQEAKEREKIKRQKERAMQKAEDAARKLRLMYKAR